MRIIKIIYDNGDNGMVKVAREAHKHGKRMCEMSSQEILLTGCGIFR